MKRIILVSLFVFLLISFASCNNAKQDDKATESAENSTVAIKTYVDENANKIILTDEEIEEQMKVSRISKEAAEKMDKGKDTGDEFRAIVSQLKAQNEKMKNKNDAKAKIMREKAIVLEARKNKLIPSDEEYLQMQKKQFEMLKKATTDKDKDTAKYLSDWLKYYRLTEEIGGYTEDEIIHQMTLTSIKAGARSYLLDKFAKDNNLDKKSNDTKLNFEKYVDELVKKYS